MKQTAMLIVALSMAAAAFAGPKGTPEALADRFITAVNAKDGEQLKATVHPDCFAGLTPVQKRYIQETLSRNLQNAIPIQRTVKITKLDGADLPFGNMVVWPVKPTHQLEVEFSTGEYSSTCMIRFIAQEKDQWFLIVPMLNSENLKKYEEFEVRQKAKPDAGPKPVETTDSHARSSPAGSR